MRSNHSPEPWSLTGNSGNICGADCRNVCNSGNVATDPTNYANAELIKEAPALLRLLKGMLATALAVDVGNFNRYGGNACGFAPELLAECQRAIERADAAADPEYGHAIAAHAIAKRHEPRLARRRKRKGGAA